MSPEAIILKLHASINNHNIDSFIDCFAIDYSSEQPVYPDRSFQGQEQVRKNWSSNFNEMPDFSAVLVRYEIVKETIWAEWDWQGTRRDKSKLHMRGVTIFGVINSKIKWARLYMEPVKLDGGGIEVAVKEVMQ